MLCLSYPTGKKWKVIDEGYNDCSENHTHLQLVHYKKVLVPEADSQEWQHAIKG